MGAFVFCFLEIWAGGPFKPDFGLSGVVPQLDRVSPQFVRVCVLSTPTQSLLALPTQAKGALEWGHPHCVVKNCSTASSLDVHTVRKPISRKSGEKWAPAD